MDGMVTYVDLAETFSRYSFYLTCLHSGGATTEVEKEREKVEKEEVVGKCSKIQSIHVFDSIPNKSVYSTEAQEQTTGWGFISEKRSEMFGSEYWKPQAHDLYLINHMRSGVNTGHN